MKTIIFTDLDGTLLNSDYSFKEALPALELIKNNSVPLVLCSSKTKIEIEHFRKKMINSHPFISENGGGIFVPRGYFKFQITDYKLQITEDGQYSVIKLGADYAELRNAVGELREEGYNTKGFGDMSIREVGKLTGLKPADAKRARQRYFDEPFVYLGNSKDIANLKRRIRAKGFNYTQGELFHIMGNSDKGMAVKILKKLYAKQHRKIVTIALGDSPNDIEMLQHVDYPVAVQKKDGSYNRELIRKVKGCGKAEGIGPDGWNTAVIELLKTVVP
jgi:mannosyl-3-phosphoglycerate phosphatase